MKTDVDHKQWVERQHQMLLRWVNSKTSLEVKDLTVDLQDGLVLIDITNKIVSEKEDSNALAIQPLHKNPKFSLQKAENLADYFKYLSLILKLTLCNINAEDILQGNLKLILGLIWSLFIYSTSNSIGKRNQSVSYFEIKEILLNWINSIITKKGIQKITNFDRDWSLEIGIPDELLFSIFDHYVMIQGFIEQNGKKLQNLIKVFHVSDNLNIARLIEPEDLSSFCPDEKSLVMYLVECYKTLALEKDYEEMHLIPHEIMNKKMIDNKRTPQIHISQKLNSQSSEMSNESVVLDGYIDLMVETFEKKAVYKEQAVSVLQKVDFNTTLMQRDLNFFKNFAIAHIVDHLSKCFTIWSEAFECPECGFEKKLQSFSENFSLLKINFKLIIECLTEFDNYREKYKANLLHVEFPTLLHSANSIDSNLRSFGVKHNCQYDHNLDISNCSKQIERMVMVEKKFQETAYHGINKLQEFPLSKLDAYLEQIESVMVLFGNQKDDKKIKAALTTCIDDMEYLIGMCHRLDFHKRNLELGISPSNLRSMMEVSERPVANPNSVEHLHAIFKEKIGKNSAWNSTELYTLLKSCTSQDYNTNSSHQILHFIDHIPTLESSYTNEHGDYTSFYSSDDSEIDSLFEGIPKSASSSSLRTCDKDLNLFINNFEQGLLT